VNKQLLSISSLSVASLLLLASPVAQAFEQGDILVRGRIINVSPNESSSVVSADAGTPPLEPVPGSHVAVTDDTVVELDFTYMLHKNWGLELILGTSEHDVPARGSLAGAGDIINASVLPPTLTLQYHFRPDATFRPYVGLGINYTKFYDERVTGGIDLSGAEVDMDSSWGLAAQIGADYMISDDWFVNIDAKYIKIETTAHFSGTAVGAAEVDVDVDPWVFGIGIGTRF